MQLLDGVTLSGLESPELELLTRLPRLKALELHRLRGAVDWEMLGRVLPLKRLDLEIDDAAHMAQLRDISLARLEGFEGICVRVGTMRRDPRDRGSRRRRRSVVSPFWGHRSAIPHRGVARTAIEPGDRRSRPGVSRAGAEAPARRCQCHFAGGRRSTWRDCPLRTAVRRLLLARSEPASRFGLEPPHAERRAGRGRPPA